MRQFEKGWVIEDKNGDYLVESDGDDFDSIFKAYIFKRKKDAIENIELADDDNEKVVKIEREIIVIFV